MIEAVGERYWPTYFAHPRPAARPGRPGRPAGDHDARTTGCWPPATRYTWIHKYVFPGGLIPSHRRRSTDDRWPRTPAVRSSSAATSGPTTRTTLRLWRRALPRRLGPTSRALGFDDDLPADVGVLPRLLRGRLPRRLPRRPARLARAPVRGADVESPVARIWVTGASQRHRRRAGPGARRPGCLGRDQRPQRREAARGRGRADARRAPGRHRPGGTVAAGAAVRAALGGLDVAVLNAGTWSRFRLERLGQRRVRRAPADEPRRAPCTRSGRDPAMRPRGADGSSAPRRSPATAALPGAEAYGATKAALLNLFESLRGRLGPRGIVVQTVCPGFVETPMTDRTTRSRCRS